MDYITAKQPHFPGALTDDAVALFRTIQADYMWIPDARQMSKAQMDVLHLLVKSGYIVSSGWYGFKARGAGWTGFSVPTPAPVDDLATVESIAIASHKRSALVTMQGGMQIRFKVTDARFLVGLVALAKAQGAPVPASYTGVLIYRVGRVA